MGLLPRSHIVVRVPQNVTSINSSATPSIEDVTNFVRQKSERGEIGANSGRLRITSLNQLGGILAADEPHTAAYLLENIESIAKRWATLNGGAKGGTAKTYESRAKGSVEDYLRWLEDPVGFQFSRRDPTAKDEDPDKPKAKVKFRVKFKKKPEVQTAAPMPMVQSTGNSPMRNFPIDQESAFDFRLPQRGITVDEWRRIACHLLTLASDFNPATPSHAQTWAIVAQSKKD